MNRSSRHQEGIRGHQEPRFLAYPVLLGKEVLYSTSIHDGLVLGVTLKDGKVLPDPNDITSPSQQVRSGDRLAARLTKTGLRGRADSRVSNNL